MTTITRTTEASQPGRKLSITDEKTWVVGRERDNLDKDILDKKLASVDQNDNKGDDNYELEDVRKDIFLKQNIPYGGYLCGTVKKRQKEDKKDKKDDTSDTKKNNEIMNSENYTSKEISSLLESHL